MIDRWLCSAKVTARISFLGISYFKRNLLSPRYQLMTGFCFGQCKARIFRLRNNNRNKINLYQLETASTTSCWRPRRSLCVKGSLPPKLGKPQQHQHSRGGCCSRETFGRNDAEHLLSPREEMRQRPERVRWRHRDAARTPSPWRPAPTKPAQVCAMQADPQDTSSSSQLLLEIIQREESQDLRLSVKLACSLKSQSRPNIV